MIPATASNEVAIVIGRLARHMTGVTHNDVPGAIID
jgi:hypothetical protein